MMLEAETVMLESLGDFELGVTLDGAQDALSALDSDLIGPPHGHPDVGLHGGMDAAQHAYAHMFAGHLQGDQAGFLQLAPHETSSGPGSHGLYYHQQHQQQDQPQQHANAAAASAYDANHFAMMNSTTASAARAGHLHLDQKDFGIMPSSFDDALTVADSPTADNDELAHGRFDYLDDGFSYEVKRESGKLETQTQARGPHALAAEAKPARRTLPPRRRKATLKMQQLDASAFSSDDELEHQSRDDGASSAASSAADVDELAASPEGARKRRRKGEAAPLPRRKLSRGAEGGERERLVQIQQFMAKVKESEHSTKDRKRRAKKEEFPCTYPGCERKFMWTWARDEHAATHMPDVGRIYACQYCDKSFFTTGCLKSHVRIHTRKPYSYVCKVAGCTKKYCTSEGLRLHTRNVHEGDKKWKCPSGDCSKSFVRQSDLRLHIIRIHSTERPYPCSQPSCIKSFACYSELKRHLASHQGASVAPQT